MTNNQSNKKNKKSEGLADLANSIIDQEKGSTSLNGAKKNKAAMAVALGILAKSESKKSLNSIISERLKDLLKTRGLTFNDLALKLDYTPTGLYLAFKRNKVTLDTLEGICEVLDVSPTYFFELEVLSSLLMQVSKSHENPDLKGFLKRYEFLLENGVQSDVAIKAILLEK